MRCLACDKVFSDTELLIGDDFCKKCLRDTFGDTSWITELTALDDEVKDNE